MGNWEVWEKNVLALADGHQGGGTEPRLLGGGRTGAGADPKRNGATWWRVRERLWARAPGTWRVRSARPWARAHLAVDQLPPPAHFGRQAPPGGGRASDTGPRGSATGQEGSVPPQPDIKNASGIYSIYNIY